MFSEEDMPKLIDFGLCIQADNRRAEHEIAGTPYYISPDVLSGVYGKECDIWSMGVCLFQFLSGNFPFDGEDMTEIFDKIKSGEFECDRDLISADAEDLIRHMIVVNPEKRFTALQVLEHSWIKQSEAKFRRKGTMFKELDDEH
tara:strand:+ start:185 stop:616 length:432 start_codon:yes stop_codon:yes gene_type:complete